MKKLLTVVILTKNEERTIKNVILNAQKCGANILVVDSGSDDKTVQIAKNYGANIVFRAWDNDFAAQRNFALQHVTTPWVLYLDADEFLDAELTAAVKMYLPVMKTNNIQCCAKAMLLVLNTNTVFLNLMK